MKLLKIKATGLKLFTGTFEIDFLATQRVSLDKNEMLSNLFSNIYTNNIISLVGKNASGKTLTLKVISFVIQLLQNKPINSTEHKEVLGSLIGAQPVSIETYFMSGKNIHKLFTTIKLVKKNDVNEERYIITDEILWSKPISSVGAKNDLFTFDFELGKIKSKKYEIITRNPNEPYLLDDVSIIAGLNKKNNEVLDMKDSIGWTDLNVTRIIGEFIPELIELLDPSIEYLKCSRYETEKLKDVEFELKFYENDEVIEVSPMELNHYLSSGTIKGINIFTTALFILTNGGYLIIDELENHFNIEIVSSLINFFIDKDTNRKGATLIFSTHYPELLDKLERNDNSYLVKKSKGILLENLSHFLKRNDIKKSDFIKSGTIEGTMPSYDSYIKLKRKISQISLIEVEQQ